MADDPQQVQDLLDQVSLKGERRAGKKKREMADELPRSGLDLKSQPEEVGVGETLLSEEEMVEEIK